MAGKENTSSENSSGRRNAKNHIIRAKGSFWATRFIYLRRMWQVIFSQWRISFYFLRKPLLFSQKTTFYFLRQQPFILSEHIILYDKQTIDECRRIIPHREAPFGGASGYGVATSIHAYRRGSYKHAWARQGRSMATLRPLAWGDGGMGLRC